MSSTKGNKLKELPVLEKPTIPRNTLKSSVLDAPPPQKNTMLEQVKSEISVLEAGGNGVRYETTNGMTLLELQKYISTITSNYSRKVGGIVKFTVRKIDNKSIGVWVTT